MRTSSHPPMMRAATPITRGALDDCRLGEASGGVVSGAGQAALDDCRLGEAPGGAVSGAGQAAAGTAWAWRGPSGSAAADFRTVGASTAGTGVVTIS